MTEQTKERDYIDSFEENKNLMMALKKSMDLGDQFHIPLADDTHMTMPQNVARHCFDVLMRIKSTDRELYIQEMGSCRTKFITGVRYLLAVKP